MTAIIEVQGLTKSYGSKRGITNVSFQVEEGEVFGFLGPNGAGKTTTMRLLMAFAVTQANRWAADEEEGRQELILATPQPRLRVLLARFGALTTATILIGVLTLAATALASATSGLALDGGNVTAATLSIIPLGLLVAALGYLFSGWLRSVIDTGLLSFLLVIWFFITFIGPGLNWPEGVLRFSAFYYYGTPLLHGLPTGDTLLVLAVALVALALASLRFVRKDIGQ